MVCIAPRAIRIKDYFAETIGFPQVSLSKILREKSLQLKTALQSVTILCLFLAGRGATGQESISLQSPTPTPTIGNGGVIGLQNQAPVSGSVPEGKATPGVLPLSFSDAINRGLRNNLGLLLSNDNTLAARGEKWKELSDLLPHLNVTATQSATQIDFAALGFRFSIPGVPTVVGPIGIFQSGVNLSQTVFDWHSIQRTRAAQESERAAHYSSKDARELVVLAVSNAYLLTVAAAARVDTGEADVETAQALFDKASDQQTAGTSPAIDTLRAHVELQSRQEELIVSRNNFAKQKLALARVIGLPPGQEFKLTTEAPYRPLAVAGIEEDLEKAYLSRADYLAAVQQERAAELMRRAATAEHYPSLDIGGNYGAAGVNAGISHGVFQAGATLNIPIAAGGHIHADVLQAEAQLRQSRQQLDNLRGQIDYEVRSARLDLQAAADQVEVARSSVDLAQQTLTQARDRFAAGVTDNLEVVQAQEALVAAKENYISSLYAHNISKVELAKAVGFAEEGVKQYLPGK